MKQSVAAFHLPNQTYYADTCEPLKQAAVRGELTLVACGRDSYPGQPLPDGTLQEVRSLGYWDAAAQQSWGLDWHYNEGIEFTYLARGKTRFQVDKEEYLLKHGDLTITRPWQVHRVGNPHISACRLYWLILDVGVRRPNQQWCWPRWLVSSDSDIECLTIMLSHNEQPVWSANAEIETYFEKLVEAATQSNESRVKLSISGLLVAITELLQNSHPSLDTRLSSAQRTVELFLASLPETLDQPWELSSMAATCGLGRSRFTHYCKEITNMSPIEYLTTCRVEKAAWMLKNLNSSTITEVAFTCGFESSQYFARIFHLYKGCSPSAFRFQYMNQLMPIHQPLKD